jgi:hypothetical protein
MQFWMLFGVLVLAELFVASRVPMALMRGSVSLNPLGWFGYTEFGEVTVERGVYPAAYWLIVAVLGVAALVFGLIIWMLAAHSIATAAL